MPVRWLLALTTLFLVFWLSPAAAQPPERTHDIELDDYFTLGVMSTCTASPDGRYVAYVEARWEKSLDGRNADLWVLDTQTRERRRLTFDPAADGSPQWSHDGRHIYFLSARKRAGETKPPLDGKAQVWRLSPGGEEASAVTRVDGGVGRFELARDGRALYYTASEEHFNDDFKALRQKHKHLEYGHGVVKVSQLWKLDLESWRAEKLIDEKRVISSFAVAPDGSCIAMITTPNGTPLFNEGWSRVDVWHADTKKVYVVTKDGWRDDHPSPYGWVDGVCWTADGRAVAFSLSFDGYPTELYVAEERDRDLPVRRLEVSDEIEVADGSRLAWRGESRELCFLGEHKARKWVCGLPEVRDGGCGKPRTLAGGDIVANAYSFDRAGGQLFAVVDTTTHTGDLYMARLDGQPGDLKRLTNVNPQVDTWKLPRIQIVEWKAPDGTTVEGILETPSGYVGDKPLPMVVELHGGPTSATMYAMRFWIYGRTLLAAKGYALLSPNYRGSTGYGRKFMTDLVARENDVEVQDILAGVDAMIERGIADPDRLGVMGWSNGGYLTNCIITATDRFKAASTGAGILDMVIQWGTEDTPGHVINYMKGLPWTAADEYRRASPVFALDHVRTPTLIHVGGADPRCPPAHSRGLYRALRHYLNVPTELVVYPGESHSLSTYKNRRAKMEWDLAWFDKYLLEKKPGREDVPEGAADDTPRAAMEKTPQRAPKTPSPTTQPASTEPRP